MEVCVAAGEKLHPHLPQKVLKKIMAKATVIIHSVRRARFGNVLTLSFGINELDSIQMHISSGYVLG